MLDQALGKLQYELPANIKNDQPISAKSQERIEPDRKPSNGHHCNPHPVREHFAPGSNWRMSQDLYNAQGRLRTSRGKVAARREQSGRPPKQSRDCMRYESSRLRVLIGNRNPE
jgi:hypothetical protein